MKSFIKLFVTAALFVSFSVLAATPPAWINYQGRLLDNNGIPVTQNNMAFVVKIWSDPASTLLANLKYSESHTVNVNDGLYSFPVGSGTVIYGTYGGSLYTNNSVLWLEITVQGETLAPRHRLLSAPYTNHSGNSEALGGQGINYFGTAAQVNSLQGQIDGMNSGLQSLCVSAGNIWDADKSECIKGGKVITYDDGQGKISIIPVDQDGVELASPDLQLECNKKHYRAVVGIPIVNCDSNPVEVPTNPYGCGFGPASEATVVAPKDCLWMQPAEPKG